MNSYVDDENNELGFEISERAREGDWTLTQIQDEVIATVRSGAALYVSNDGAAEPCSR